VGGSGGEIQWKIGGRPVDAGLPRVGTPARYSENRADVLPLACTYLPETEMVAPLRDAARSQTHGSKAIDVGTYTSWAATQALGAASQ
jgi:hypothetical protein